MTTDYERRLIVSYLANAAARLHHRDRAASALAEWVMDREDGAGFASRRLRSRLEREDIDPDERLSGGDWRSFRRALRDECAATRHGQPDLTARRLQRLAETTGLDRTDVAILELLLRYHTQPIIESMIDEVLLRSTMFERLASRTLKGSVVPALLGVSAGTVRDRLSDGVPLVSSGLVSVERDGDVTIVDRLRRLATVPASAGLDASRLLLDPAPRSELEWSDFDHIAEGRDHIERLIRGALRTSAPGVNILLYGPPGTGKTEFCKVLAERLGVTLYGVGEADDDGDEPSRSERLQELRLAQRLLARDGRSLLLFDEMEDLLSEGHAGLSLFGQPFFGGSRNGGSKVYTHRLLERAPAPTLWAMNDARSVSQTLLRRMMFALELRPPTATVRARIWSRQLEHHGIEAGPDEAHALAREFVATPGVAAGATAAARIGGGGIETVRRGVRGLSRVLSCDAPPQGTPPLFDPALIQADTDPVALADSLVDSGERRFSLCLQGPPGTGKSAFARYLAERMRLEVMERRASDLMSMWVGGTERNIAAAFAEARDTGAFLIFDEADSLLADRRGAERSWEVSQVNEMLTWMESHPLPFACTTNYGEHLDAATLRRFVFKVALDYLSPEQIEAAVRIYFGLRAPADVTALTALTPGDFAVVRRKAALLGRLEAPDALATMLGAECAAKPDRPRPVGFRAKAQ
ncbi:MAG: AAA family ATPase [Rhodospirillales bacterium]|nr:AAA family ATPase [Rhodospirillales bacterium]